MRSAWSALLQATSIRMRGMENITIVSEISVSHGMCIQMTVFWVAASRTLV